MTCAHVTGQVDLRIMEDLLKVSAEGAWMGQSHKVVTEVPKEFFDQFFHGPERFLPVEFYPPLPGQ